MRQILLILITLSLFAGLAYAEDPGKPDSIIVESAKAKRGDSFELAIRIMADDSVSFNNQSWQGVGNFCIPLKYDSQVLKLDSTRFVGPFAEWDEKFTNPKIDTGFISFAGIYYTGGEVNTALFSPDQPQEVIRMFFHTDKKAKKGTYAIELTTDPIQKERYIGSPDGVHSWQPQFVPGKIELK